MNVVSLWFVIRLFHLNYDLEEPIEFNVVPDLNPDRVRKDDKP